VVVRTGRDDPAKVQLPLVSKPPFWIRLVVVGVPVGVGVGVGVLVEVGVGVGVLPVPNWTSRTAWSSMPLGATPVCPCRKSKKPTPVTVTETLAVLNELVGV
jgi:hypothetical protein